MRARTLRWIPIAAVLLLSLIANSGQAQPPRSGGFDFSLGIGRGAGSEYKDRTGMLNAFELFFSTRMDGSNTALLMGFEAIYFATDDGDHECLPSEIVAPPACVRKFPDIGGGGLLVAFEPNILSNTFVHLNSGFGVVQPTSDGGPTIAYMGSIKIGQSIGRHLAIMGGGRVLYVPNMRGDPVVVPAFHAGLRIR